MFLPYGRPLSWMSDLRCAKEVCSMEGVFLSGQLPAIDFPLKAKLVAIRIVEI